MGYRDGDNLHKWKGKTTDRIEAVADMVKRVSRIWLCVNADFFNFDPVDAADTAYQRKYPIYPKL